MSGSGAGVSEYEIARLERIKENKKLIDELFPDGTTITAKDPSIDSSVETLTPEGSVTGVCVTRSKRKLCYRRPPARRNKKRQYVTKEVDYDGPITRSMRVPTSGDSSGSSPVLVDGLDDDIREFRRVVYRTSVPKKRKVVVEEEDPVPIELDGLPGVNSGVLKRVLYNSKKKVYDRINGTTCHQCRQKTKDQKTICHNKNCVGVRGQFCGCCLKNRYGEDVREALLNPEWVCPPCRGKCNCSFCLPKKGRPPTGIMIHIAKEAGYDSVQEYLERSNYDY